MSYLLFGGGMYMVLMALVWLIQPARNAINYYFAAMYSSSGLIVLYAWAERTNFIYQIYLVYNIQIPLCYVFAPLLYYGFSQITELHRKPAAFDFRHFIPAAVSFPIIIANNLWHAPLFQRLSGGMAPIDLHAHPAFLAIHILGLLSNVYILYFLFRIIITGVSLFRDKNLETTKELRSLLMYVVMFVLDILLMIVAHLRHNKEILYLAKLLSSLTFILYSFYSFRYPEYSQKVIRKAKLIRYKNTQLGGLNTEELLDRLGYLMSSEKIFRDTELTLVSLGAQLMVTPNQLSEILNERLHMNFRSYLNDFRVREAERMLLEKSEASIIEIAFEVGFNSKASFNEHFLKKTGLTPSDYRKREGATPQTQGCTRIPSRS
jgi:AraC-like DNA-binding protein